MRSKEIDHDLTLWHFYNRKSNLLQEEMGDWEDSINDGADRVELDFYSYYKRKKWNRITVVNTISIVLVLVYFTYKLLLSESESPIRGIENLIFIGVILSVGTQLISVFSKYESTKTQDGSLVLSVDGISTRNGTIDWSDVKILKYTGHEINGKSRVYRGWENGVSDGINSFEMIAVGGRKIEGWIRFESVEQVLKLRQILLRAVRENEVRNELYKSVMESTIDWVE